MQALILGNDHLPSLNEVYVHIHRDDRRHGVMNPSFIEKSALVSTSTRGGRGENFGHGRVDATILLLMIEITSSANIAGGLGTPKNSVGITMDNP